MSFEKSDHVKKWVELNMLPHGESFGASQSVGFHNVDGSLVAGVVYHNYSPSSGTIELSAYAKNRTWTNKEVIKAIFDYPFEQLGCRMAISRTSGTNKRVIRIWTALGATHYTIPDLRADGEDEIISILRREDWETSKFKRKA